MWQAQWKNGSGLAWAKPSEKIGTGLAWAKPSEKMIWISMCQAQWIWISMCQAQWKNGSGLACAQPSKKWIWISMCQAQWKKRIWIITWQAQWKTRSGLSSDKPSKSDVMKKSPACRRVIARESFQNIKMAWGKHRSHASNTDLGDTIPRRIRRPVGKRTTTCRDYVCGRLAYDWGELQWPVQGGNRSPVV